MTGTEPTWEGTRATLARVLASAHTADEWVREALEATHGVQDESELSRPARQAALHRIHTAARILERDTRDLAFTIGARAVVADAFAQSHGGLVLQGPPWRMDPAETQRTYDEWAAAADFNWGGADAGIVGVSSGDVEGHPGRCPSEERKHRSEEVSMSGRSAVA